ncbi:MAG: flagellar hook-basal body complex protein FliE [Tindallia sp. MSAO_Bac2]|nr:MAG: flagellar hook-basal body complex protein FliE [Tindallia sp. MSAO_Bac2]
MQINSNLNREVQGLGLFNKNKQDKPSSFSDFFGQAINNVNQLQLDSDHYAEKLATGDIENVHEAMIASQKADISMQMMTAVRGKIMDAYQEIMRMQI